VDLHTSTITYFVSGMVGPCIHPSWEVLGFRVTLLVAICFCTSVSEETAKALRGSQGHLASSPSERVDCSMALPADNGLLLLTSSGLGTWGPDNTLTADDNMMNAFRDLILQLPDVAWEVDGAAKKQEASGRSAEWLAEHRFKEPELYAGLEVVIIDDACFLKDSFWNEANPDFNISSGIGTNYLKSNMTTSVDLVRPFFGDMLDGGWCVDFSAQEPGYLGGLGFDLQRVHHISLWDRLAGDSLKRDVFEIQVNNAAPEGVSEAKADRQSAEGLALLDLLSAADIIIVNGGNPDFVKYVLKQFAHEIMAAAIGKLHAGSLVYMGESAGSMVGSADVGLTYENTPNLYDKLLQADTSGLALAGNCAIRPHDHGEIWDLASAVYGKLKSLNVVRLPNGDGLRCMKAQCEVVGLTGKPGPSVFTGPHDPHLARLADIFRGLPR